MVGLKDKIIVTEKDNVKLVSIGDYLSPAEFCAETKKVNCSFKDLAFSVIWDTGLQMVNKGLIYIFAMNGTLYNVLVNDEKIIIDEKVKIGEETEEICFESNKDDDYYYLKQVKTNNIGSTYYSKHFYDGMDEFFGDELTAKEAYLILSSLVDNIDVVDGIENIIDKNKLKTTLARIGNKIEPSL